MAENLINYLNEKLGGNTEFYVDAELDRDLNRLKEATNYDRIYHDAKFKMNLEGSKIIKIFKKIFRRKHCTDVSNYYDSIIYLGGDDFSEFYMKGWKSKVLISLNILDLKFLNKNSNVILIGQTIGPYTGIRKIIAKKVFPYLKIYTRDDVNLKVMKKKYDTTALASRDLAFLDLKLQEYYKKNKNKILNKYGLIEDGYLTIVGTELIKHYTSNEEEFINGFIDMVKVLKEKYVNKKIVWLSHVTSYPPNLSDNYLLKLINEKFDNFIDKNLVVISERLLPVEARLILGYGYLTITCRMHAAVSTFQMGKPAICLSYSPKYRGVIADGLNMHNLVIEAKNNELWKNNIARVVLEKTDYVDENYTFLQTQIKENVDECKIIVNKTLDEISQEIMNKIREKKLEN